MKVAVRESTMVRPAKETPVVNLWSSSLDLIASDYHTQSVYYYRRPNGAPNFFDANVMKDSLSWVLVAFYPLAGRFKQAEDGRIEINCRGQGVVFLEAESDGVIDDFGDFAPTLESVKLVPPVDCSLGIESFPLLALQVTYFKCGGVTLGYSCDHRVNDGRSFFHFMRSWSELARGLDITLPPFIDRTLLRARDPPRPVFDHVEYQSDPIPPQPQVPLDETKIIFKMFKVTRNQLDMLKAKLKKDGTALSYTSFEILAGHLWKCVCKARRLPDDTIVKLDFSVDGRARLQPPLPPGYYGNAVFTGCAVATAGEIQSKPSWYTVSKVHDALARMNNDYLKSTIDYLEQHGCKKPEVSYKYSNLLIVSWGTLPANDADFGWGRPIFLGRVGIRSPGRFYVSPSPIKDGSLSIIIGLEVEQMKLFSELLYATMTDGFTSNL